MKKFQFRLQKVLQHRRVIKDLAQTDHQKAVSELNETLAELERFREQKSSTILRRFDSQSQGGKFIPELLQIDGFLQGQDLRIALQLKKVQEKEIIVEEKRQILSKAAQEVKIIEKLEERQKQHFQEEFLKNEQAEMDEHAVLRFGKSSKDFE